MNKIIMEKTASQGAASSKPSTTFVQADLSSFREVVQRLTGPSDSDPVHDGSPLKPMGVKRPMFKLHERRQYTRTKLEIIKPTVQFKLHSADQKSFSPSKSGNSGFVPSPLSTPSKPLSNLSIACFLLHLPIMSEKNDSENAAPPLCALLLPLTCKKQQICTLAYLPPPTKFHLKLHSWLKLYSESVEQLKIL